MEKDNFKCNLTEIFKQELNKRNVNVYSTSPVTNLTEIQEELAVYCNVEVEDIIAIERGNLVPSLITATKIADFFNVPVSDIFQFENSTGINIGDVLITKTAAGVTHFNFITHNEKGNYVLHNIMGGITTVEFNHLLELKRSIDSNKLLTNVGPEQIIKYIPRDLVQQTLFMRLVDTDEQIAVNTNTTSKLQDIEDAKDKMKKYASW